MQTLIVNGNGNLISRINHGCLELLVHLFPLPKVLKMAENFLHPFYILRSRMHVGSALHKYVTNPKTKCQSHSVNGKFESSEKQNPIKPLPGQ